MKNNKILIISVSVTISALVVILLASSVVYAAYDRTYADRIFPGVRIWGISVGGLSPADASQQLHQTLDQKLSRGIRFQYQGHDVAVSVQGENPDSSHDALDYHLDEALQAAYREGRSGGVVQQALTRLRMRTYPVTVSVSVHVDREAITQKLLQGVQGQLVQTRNASFEIGALAKPPIVTIAPEQDGAVVLTDQAVDIVEAHAPLLDFSPIALSARSEHPNIRARDLEPLVPRVQELLSHPMPTFTYQNHEYPVTVAQLANWITVTGTAPNVDLAFDQAKFFADMSAIAPGIEQEAKNGSLEVKEGKIVAFVSGKTGIEIDRALAYDELSTLWPATTTLSLVVHETASTLTGEDPDRLGIKELIGIGKSNFSGSPVNRRKNIAHGVALVNGTVIQPGETFSMLKTLGPVDGEHNWLPELVIKGNQTKPEFGGGLCQIGTTAFRGALASGLPIVERQNHSYRVRYYEPAGTDATIYEPAPDFKFLNDTATPIYINGYIKGDDVYFEFWGTKDGRKAEQTAPHIYNIVPPPPMKTVESLDIPVGTKKCTETAHAGADADFTYTVTYANAEVKKEVFRSHYKPWQAVCMVGVAKLSTDISAASTSTVPVTP